MKETAFLYFHISLFACSHNTCSPASDYIRCIRTSVLKMQTPDMLKIPESGLIHFLLYWLRYKKVTAAYINSAIKNKTQPKRYYKKPDLQAFYQQRSDCVIYYPGIAITAEVPGTPYRISGGAQEVQNSTQCRVSCMVCPEL